MIGFLGTSALNAHQSETGGSDATAMTALTMHMGFSIGARTCSAVWAPRTANRRLRARTGASSSLAHRGTLVLVCAAGAAVLEAEQASSPSQQVGAQEQVALGCASCCARCHCFWVALLSTSTAMHQTPSRPPLN